ncbi:Uma2 family endonuclease [Saccharopolyspora hirsuta]|uniref:Uma2 family endonuclease n=1 Tax=Saccharopolyspora hirsuta TaxID=1837 RepID=A0A5M7BIW2_SACHI|nr:Uma2 family endonuclease [Saccharopolyspora hirsuta]KAA5828670.1 Uma2 family endonuclease [Saccharopolyspora hirsuta]
MTVDDMALLPPDVGRYELVGGRVELSHPQVLWHARAVSRLAYAVGLRAPRGLEVLFAPVVIFNDERTHCRRPDLTVFSRDAWAEPWLASPPLLAVEVASAETAARDYRQKFFEYAEFGIPAYWIIGPDKHWPAIDEFRLDDGEYRHVQQIAGEDAFATDFPFPLRLVPHWLFADGPWRERISGEGA